MFIIIPPVTCIFLFQDFGYAFNKAGQLRQLEKDGTTISDRPFVFEVWLRPVPFLICSCQVKPGDRAHNQAHYEALGEVKKRDPTVYELVFSKICFAQVITEEVYNILETEGGLERREVVLEDGRKERPRSFVFASPGFQEKEMLQVEKLQSSLILQLYFRC